MSNVHWKNTGFQISHIGIGVGFQSIRFVAGKYLCLNELLIALRNFQEQCRGPENISPVCLHVCP